MNTDSNPKFHTQKDQTLRRDSLKTKLTFTKDKHHLHKDTDSHNKDTINTTYSADI